MAKNTASGHRKGSVVGRSQFKTASGNYAKRDAQTGRIVDVKKDKSPFKGIRKELGS